MSSTNSLASSNLQLDSQISHSLVPVVIATVVLYSVLITTSVAARLLTKHLVSSLKVEDCEFRYSLRYMD